jgi:hypothetical protein
MSEPATITPVSVSASGYEDGLGRRTLEFDRETGGMLERLHLRPELGAFETFLSERVLLATALDGERFARHRGIERDDRNVLTVLSQFVAGNRLCDLLEAATSLPADEATSPSVDAALGFLLDALPTLGSLHLTTGAAHGTLGPGRIVLTHDGRVVILDAVFGPAIERLQLNRRRLWLELGLATPDTAGPARLDAAADVAQASLVAMMIVLGRPLRDNEYPEGIATLLTEVIEIAQIRGGDRFASGLQTFLSRTLPLPTQDPHASAEAAASEVQQVAGEIGVARCRAALAAFVGDMNRVLADTRERAGTVADPFDDEIEAAIEVEACGAEAASASTVLHHVPEESYAAAEEYVPEPLPATALGSFDIDGPRDLVDTAAPVESGLERDPGVSGLGDEGRQESVDPPAVAPVVEEPRYEPAPVSATEPEVVAAVFVPEPQPEPVLPPVPWIEPEPESEPVRVAPDPPAVAKRPEPPPPPLSKRKRRGSKPHRDKLRSNAIPKTVAAPPPPPLPVQLGAALPAPGFGRIGEPLRHETHAPIQIAPVQVPRPAPPPKPPAPLRIKADGPSGYSPAPQRTEWRDPTDVSATPYVHRRDPASFGGIPWRLAAAALVLIIVGVVAGRAYLPGRSTSSEKPAAATVATPAKPVEATKGGTLVLTTQPAGARVLLDGKAVGESPLNLTDVAAGRRSLTLVTSAGSVKKVVRIEAGKTTTLDIPIYSGWIVVFAPVPLDIAENGRAIGSSDQGRLMLSPGLHQLTLTNRNLGYKGVQIVDIEPGEERSISIQPTGELNVNAVPWAEVWMAGKKVGETPIAGLQVPIGTHEIVFKNPQFPEQRATVTVTGAAPTAAAVDFTK